MKGFKTRREIWFKKIDFRSHNIPCEYSNEILDRLLDFHFLFDFYFVGTKLILLVVKTLESHSKEPLNFCLNGSACAIPIETFPSITAMCILLNFYISYTVAFHQFSIDCCGNRTLFGRAANHLKCSRINSQFSAVRWKSGFDNFWSS